MLLNLNDKDLTLDTRWNWTYIRPSENVQDVSWTSYVRSDYIQVQRGRFFWHFVNGNFDIYVLFHSWLTIMYKIYGILVLLIFLWFKLMLKFLKIYAFVEATAWNESNFMHKKSYDVENHAGNAKTDFRHT